MTDIRVGYMYDLVGILNSLAVLGLSSIISKTHMKQL